jgi:hypothetical protein
MTSDIFKFQKKVFNLPKDIHHLLREFGVNKVNNHLICSGKIDVEKYKNLDTILIKKVFNLRYGGDYNSWMVPFSNGKFLVIELFDKFYTIQQRKTLGGLNQLTIFDNGDRFYLVNGSSSYVTGKHIKKSH